MDSTDSAPPTPSAMPLADHSTPGPLADHGTPGLLAVSPGLLTVSSLPRFGSTPAGKAAGAGDSERHRCAIAWPHKLGTDPMASVGYN